MIVLTTDIWENSNLGMKAEELGVEGVAVLVLALALALATTNLIKTTRGMNSRTAIALVNIVNALVIDSEMMILIRRAGPHLHEILENIHSLRRGSLLMLTVIA